MRIFVDREQAGRRLGAVLTRLRREEPVVLGLPRGGVLVAAAVARALRAPLDVIVVRKLGVPYKPELAMGAVSEGGVRVLDDDVLRRTGVSLAELAVVERRERAEVAARAARFRQGRERIGLAARTVVLVDDGIATGSTMRAACRVARGQAAGRIVVAVPVAPPDAPGMFRVDADEFMCLATPTPFYAVGQWYEDFAQVSDADVSLLLKQSSGSPDPPGDPPEGDVAGQAARDDDVSVDAGIARLDGRLTVPRDAPALVVFVHGSGSSRHSPRNHYVAGVLNRAGLGTLLFDLLTPDEEVRRANVFDIELLAGRLAGATLWLREELGDEGLPLGYFGASTGAAAALVAAAHDPELVRAVVSRGGRPDLAGAWLGHVRAPTLLIVGGRDHVVLELNAEAQRRLHCTSRIEVVPGATHLFEEPGALPRAAALARDWFRAHLRRGCER